VQGAAKQCERAIFLSQRFNGKYAVVGTSFVNYCFLATLPDLIGVHRFAPSTFSFCRQIVTKCLVLVATVADNDFSPLASCRDVDELALSRLYWQFCKIIAHGIRRPLLSDKRRKLEQQMTQEAIGKAAVVKSQTYLRYLDWYGCIYLKIQCFFLWPLHKFMVGWTAAL
jgi:hypothetical protein